MTHRSHSIYRCQHTSITLFFLSLSSRSKSFVSVSPTMPEGFTYFDMARRLKAAFPSPENFKLDVFEENGRYAGIGDATYRLKRRTAKLKARERRSIPNFSQMLRKSFPGLTAQSTTLIYEFLSPSAEIKFKESRGKGTWNSDH